MNTPNTLYLAKKAVHAKITTTKTQRRKIYIIINKNIIAMRANDEENAEGEEEKMAMHQ